MYIVGLTGGIGSGKSTAARYLNHLGFKSIDFDKLTRDIEVPGHQALADVVEAFGPETLNPDGTMNRQFVGRVVFSDPDEKVKLDNIMRRYVDVLVTEITDDFRRSCEGLTREVCPDDYLQRVVLFYDHPILFEVPCHIVQPDEVWVVDLEDEARIRRIMERDGLSREDIMKRINSQLPREEKLRLADYVIDNSGTEEDLYHNIDVAIQRLDEKL